MNVQKLNARLESCNRILCLRLMKLLRKELRSNRLLDLKNLWIVSRIQAQVMATLATNARAGMTAAELARLREMMDKTPEEFRDAFLGYFIKKMHSPFDDGPLRELRVAKGIPFSPPLCYSIRVVRRLSFLKSLYVQ